MPERTVLLHETPLPSLDAPPVQTWHLEGDDPSETLCERTLVTWPLSLRLGKRY